MTLSAWIEKAGNKKIAKLLNVEPSTVSSWKTKEKFPRPQMLKAIHDASGRRVSYKSMVEEYLKRNRKN